MTTERELLADLAAHPDDDARFQVYADFLTDLGDPRGELVSVQLRREQHSTDAILIAREAKLLAQHREKWLGPLADIKETQLGLTWRRGFLETARIGLPLDVRKSAAIDHATVIEVLMMAPIARLLRGLTSTPSTSEPGSFQPTVEGLARADVPNTLRHLEFHRGEYWDSSWTRLHDLSPAYPKLTNLRSLKLLVGHLELGEIALPRLRSLEIITGGLTVTNIESVAKAQWPQLERLVLYVGERRHGSNIQLADLKPILEARNLERVRHLGLANCEFADELPGALAEAKILPRLETLDLSHGTLGRAGARALIHHRKAFAHLKRLNLSASFVPNEFERDLLNLGPEVDLSEPQGDREDRYVAVGE